MGVFRRGNKLWLSFKDTDGNWKNVSTGHSVGEEEAARRKYEAVVDAVARVKAGGRPTRVRIVAVYPNDAERVVSEQPLAEPGDFQDITADLDGQRWGLLLHRGHLVNGVEVSAAQAYALGGCSCRSESIPCALHSDGDPF